MNKKVVLITDGTEEIGNEVGVLFASKGYNIVLCYNENRKKAYELRKYIKNNYNVETQVIKIDTASVKNVKKTITMVIKKFGRTNYSFYLCGSFRKHNGQTQYTTGGSHAQTTHCHHRS